MADPITLTRTSPDLYCWPSGRVAVRRFAHWWIARHDAGPDLPGLVRGGQGDVRLFDTPTLAASALGARLPAE